MSYAISVPEIVFMGLEPTSTEHLSMPCLISPAAYAHYNNYRCRVKFGSSDRLYLPSTSSDAVVGKGRSCHMENPFRQDSNNTYGLVYNGNFGKYVVCLCNYFRSSTEHRTRQMHEVNERVRMD